MGFADGTEWGLNGAVRGKELQAVCRFLHLLMRSSCQNKHELTGCSDSRRSRHISPTLWVG